MILEQLIFIVNTKYFMNRLHKNAMPVPLLSKGALLCSSLCEHSDPTITQASI